VECVSDTFHRLSVVNSRVSERAHWGASLAPPPGTSKARARWVYESRVGAQPHDPALTARAMRGEEDLREMDLNSVRYLAYRQMRSDYPVRQRLQEIYSNGSRS
jgi:hypothetical protein